MGLGTAAYLSAGMPASSITGQLNRAYLVLYGVPGLAVTVVALVARHYASPRWARVCLIIIAYAIAAPLGVRLSAGIVDFVNAAG